MATGQLRAPQVFFEEDEYKWTASQTGRNVASESCKITNYGKNPDIKYLKEANKTPRKLKNKDVEIHNPIVGDMRREKIVCYTGGTHANLSCGSSQVAYYKVVPLSWQSKKLTRVIKSSLASKTLALGDGAYANYLIGSLIKEVFLLPNMAKIKCMPDNKSLFDILTITNVTKDLWLKVDIGRLLQM